MFFRFSFFTHVKLVGYILYLLDDGIKAAASGSGGDADGVAVEVDGDDAAFVALLDLVGDVEDHGAVHAVVELHLDFEVVAHGRLLYLMVGLAGAGDVEGVAARESERHGSSADDVDRLVGAVGVGVIDASLHAHEVVDGDVVLAGNVGLEVDRARHAGKVARAFNLRDEVAIVVVEDDLRHVDVGHGRHLQRNVLVPDVVDNVVVVGGIVGDVEVVIRPGKEELGLVEGKSGCVVGRIDGSMGRCLRADHGLVGEGGDILERAGLVEVQRLHTVDGLDVVPHHEVVVSVLVGSLEAGAVDEVGEDGGVGRVGILARIVATNVEGGGFGDVPGTEDLHVVLVPSIVPLGLPVVFQLVLPEHLEVGDDGAQFGLDGLTGIVELEGRLHDTGVEREQHGKADNAAQDEGRAQTDNVPGQQAQYTL